MGSYIYVYGGGSTPLPHEVSDVAGQTRTKELQAGCVISCCRYVWHTAACLTTSDMNAGLEEIQLIRAKALMAAKAVYDNSVPPRVYVHLPVLLLWLAEPALLLCRTLMERPATTSNAAGTTVVQIWRPLDAVQYCSGRTVRQTCSDPTPDALTARVTESVCRAAARNVTLCWRPWPRSCSNGLLFNCISCVVHTMVSTAVY